jgi:hypothetical protein
MFERCCAATPGNSRRRTSSWTGSKTPPEMKDGLRAKVRRRCRCNAGKARFCVCGAEVYGRAARYGARAAKYDLREVVLLCPQGSTWAPRGRTSTPRGRTWPPRGSTSMSARPYLAPARRRLAARLSREARFPRPPEAAARRCRKEQRQLRFATLPHSTGQPLATPFGVRKQSPPLLDSHLRALRLPNTKAEAIASALQNVREQGAVLGDGGGGVGGA